MTEQLKQTVKCKDCGRILDEPSNTQIDESAPCPSGGSKPRHFEIGISVTVEAHAKLGIKARRGGKSGRPFLESVSGDDLYRKTGRWMSLERVVDRENNKYKEVVSDPETGEVVHHCEEPLSQHKGHGSAKSMKHEP